MARVTRLTCQCGEVELELLDDHIVSTECCCTSCREAGSILERLPSAPKLLEESGVTRFVLYRKDRVSCAKGAEELREHRLTPDSKTRRVVATCCNTAMFLDFTSGHWISLYGRRWSSAERPAVEIRTMTSDLPKHVKLPGDVSSSQVRLIAKLIGAWVAMGFRTPKVCYVKRQIDAR
jgi:hypothetical protein